MIHIGSCNVSGQHESSAAIRVFNQVSCARAPFCVLEKMGLVQRIEGEITSPVKIVEQRVYGKGKDFQRLLLCQEGTYYLQSGEKLGVLVIEKYLKEQLRKATLADEEYLDLNIPVRTSFVPVDPLLFMGEWNLPTIKEVVIRVIHKILEDSKPKPYMKLLGKVLSQVEPTIERFENQMAMFYFSTKVTPSVKPRFFLVAIIGKGNCLGVKILNKTEAERYKTDPQRCLETLYESDLTTPPGLDDLLSQPERLQEG